MNEDNEKWINDVLGSMKGSERARPSQDLFEKIKGQIGETTIKMVSLRQWSTAAAAAILLLFLNVMVLQQYTASDLSNADTQVEDFYQADLISSFKIYE